jgi:hypothetical protein
MGFTTLPTDIHLTIADFLPLTSIHNLTLVSRILNKVYTPCVYTTAVQETIVELKQHFSDERYWEGHFDSKWTRNLSRIGSYEQVHRFLQIFSVVASKTNFDSPPPDVLFISEPAPNIPLAILRTALSADSLRDHAFIDSLSAHLRAAGMNVPGWTPIYSILGNPTLIASGHADILVKNGMDINFLYDGYSRPIQTAIIELQLEVVKWLVSVGADVNAVDGYEGLPDWTPVNTALSSSWGEDNTKTRMAILKFLVEECGADVNGAPGKVRAFEQLGTKVQVWMRGAQGRPEAMKKGCRELKVLLPLLVRWGANPDVFEARTPGGGPLHWVVDERHRFEPGVREDLIKGLITLKAPLELKDENGETPLLKAMNCSKDKAMNGVIKILVKNGADIYSKDRRGETALAMAKRRGRRDLVDLMTLQEWESEGSESDYISE